MNPANSEEDDIRPEYDLASMQVRRMGKDRKSFAGHTVRLEDDVAEMFPSAEAVNEALRLVMRIMQQNQELATVATKIGIGHDTEK
jgi:Flp pilus assembly protein CpaB